MSALFASWTKELMRTRLKTHLCHPITTSMVCSGSTGCVAVFTEHAVFNIEKTIERHSGRSLFVKHTKEQVLSSSFATYDTYIHIAGKSTTFHCSALIIVYTWV